MTTLDTFARSGVSLLWASRNLGAAARGSSDMDTGAMVVWLMIAAGGIAAVCLGLYVLSRTLQKRRRYSHPALFVGLCRVHGLRRGARAVLAQLARSHGLNHPARLFLEPEWFDPDRLPAGLRSRSNEVAVLREKLCGAA